MQTPKYSFKLLCAICLISWLIGAMFSIGLFYSSSENYRTNIYHSNTVISPFSNNVELLNSRPISRICKIFIHNSIVALIICLGGFITAGFITIMILTFNGFIVMSVIINVAINNKGYGYIANHLVWHGTFELSALIWFGAVGLSGFHAWRQFLKSSPILFTDFFPLRRILTPVLLLAIAAIIEGF